MAPTRFWLLESSIVPSSWAPQVRQNLSAVGIPLPDVLGAGSGCSPQSLARWKHGCVRPALDQLGWQQRHIGASQLPALFRLCRASPRLCSSTHVSRLRYGNGRSQDVLHGWAPCPAPQLVRHMRMWLKLNVITSYCFGTRGSIHPDPDPDPKIRNKSSKSVPDLSFPDQRTQPLKINVALGVRSSPSHICSTPVPDQTRG